MSSPDQGASIRRREFITILMGAAVGGPPAAFAQSSSSKVYRLGTLQPGMPLTEKTPLGSILLQGLEQRGYVIGKNLSLDARGAAGLVEQAARTRPRNEGGQGRCDRGGWLSRGTRLQGRECTDRCRLRRRRSGRHAARRSAVASGGNITGTSDNAATLSTSAFR